MTRPPQFFVIPAGTPARECRSCGVSIFWIATANGKRMPVVVGGAGVAPTASVNGKGISHFANCADASARRTRRT
jgi:hypothetical protein